MIVASRLKSQVDGYLIGMSRLLTGLWVDLESELVNSSLSMLFICVTQDCFGIAC